MSFSEYFHRSQRTPRRHPGEEFCQLQVGERREAGGAEHLAGVLERHPVPVDERLESRCHLAKSPRAGRRTPTTPFLRAIVPDQHRDHDCQVRGDRTFAAKLPQRRVVVLDDPKLHPRGQFCRVVRHEPVSPSHLGGGTVDDRQVLQESCFEVRPPGHSQ